MISLLITLLVLCLIFAMVWLVISRLPLPPTVRPIVEIIFAVLVILVLLWYLPPMAPHHLLR